MRTPPLDCWHRAREAQRIQLHPVVFGLTSLLAALSLRAVFASSFFCSFILSPSVKLTSEYIDVMGGVNSDLFSYYRMLVTRGFLEARAHVDEFVVLCAVHQHTSHMPCFSGPTGATAIDAMRERFAMHLQSESEVEKFVDQLIDTSIDNWRTVSNQGDHTHCRARHQRPDLGPLIHVRYVL